MSFESRKNYCFQEYSDPPESECSASKFREELHEDINKAKIAHALSSESKGVVTLSLEKDLSASGKNFAEAVSRVQGAIVPTNDLLRDLFSTDIYKASSEQMKERIEEAIEARENVDEKQLASDLQTIETSRRKILSENPYLPEDQLPDFRRYSTNSLYTVTNIKMFAFHYFRTFGIHDEASKYAQELLPVLNETQQNERVAVQSYLHERWLDVTPAMQKRFAEIFNKLDADGDKSVEKAELETFLQRSLDANDIHMLKALLYHYDELPALHDDSFFKKDNGISREDMHKLGGPAQDQPAKLVNALKHWLNNYMGNDDSYVEAYYRVFAPGS